MTMRQVKKLSDRRIASLKTTGRHSDGNNLHLCLDDRGNRRWTFLFRFGGKHGKTYEAGLGPYPLVTLKRARALALEGCQMLAAKPPINPLTVWRAPERPPIPTFGQMVESFLEEKAPTWKGERNRAQIATLLRGKTKPIARLLISEVGAVDVIRVLKPVAAKTPVQFDRLRRLIEAVINSAVPLGHIDRATPNPASWRGHLDQLPWATAATARTVRHHAAMPYAEIPSFFAELCKQRRDANGTVYPAAFALALLILTACRVQEVLGAEWSEIDIEARTWSIPPCRMKAGREHVIPLSDAALEIFEAMAEIRRSSPLVFPAMKRGVKRDEAKTRTSRARTPMSAKIFERLLGRMGHGNATPHGFRSGFRDYAGDETSAEREVCEAALAHAVGDQTERSYRRGSAFQKRAILMDEWASYVTGGNIVPMRKRA
jgi:integrase